MGVNHENETKNVTITIQISCAELSGNLYRFCNVKRCNFYDYQHC
jgi:hypothetical protein